MTLNLGPELESIVVELARKQGVDPQSLILETLRERFLAVPDANAADWVQLLRQAASDCGVSLRHSALSSEGLYD